VTMTREWMTSSPTTARKRGTLAPSGDARAGAPCLRRRASARPGAGERGGTESLLPRMREGGDATGSPRSRCSWWGATAAAVGVGVGYGVEERGGERGGLVQQCRRDGHKGTWSRGSIVLHLFADPLLGSRMYSCTLA
jgi:hypothetical protein